MSLEEAQKHWPSGTAVGKLNIVFADGKEPRLVLDSTICGVNPRCHLPERVALPMASDIRLATQAHDPRGAFVGASIDFKAAHKQVKVREEDHGLLLFQHDAKLFYYRVCHFGGRFSAYWWQRVGAFLLRQVHHILSLMPHKAWLYVALSGHRRLSPVDYLHASDQRSHQLEESPMPSLHHVVRMGSQLRLRYHPPGGKSTSSKNRSQNSLSSPKPAASS